MRTRKEYRLHWYVILKDRTRQALGDFEGLEVLAHTNTGTNEVMDYLLKHPRRKWRCNLDPEYYIKTTFAYYQIRTLVGYLA